MKHLKINLNLPVGLPLALYLLYRGAPGDMAVGILLLLVLVLIRLRKQ